LQERLGHLERENARLGHINAEVGSNLNRLLVIEEELSESEKKRNEIKQDAQETIKL
jgi:hypothetical protein